MILVMAFAACETDKKDEQEGQAEKLNIVCTTSQITDAARRIAGDRAKVTGLMGPSVDPHLYKASQGDIGKLTDADVIFYNGLHLEGKMTDVLKKMAKKGEQEVVAVADGIDPSELIRLEEYGDAYDPHIWFDISMWSDAVDFMSAVLEDTDTLNADFYKSNAQKFIGEIDEFSQWAHAKMDSLPLTHRVLVTAHDAFEYFGREYTVQVIGLQGISTASDYGLRDVTNLVDFIIDNKVKAVFVETSVPRRSIEAVVDGCQKRGHDVSIGGTLYSDALGAAGTPEGDYLGMYRSNVKTIYNALK